MSATKIRLVSQTNRSMESTNLTDVLDPIDDQDAATKKYVDDNTGTGATIEATTNLIEGDGLGNGVNSGVAAADLVVKATGATPTTLNEVIALLQSAGLCSAILFFFSVSSFGAGFGDIPANLSMPAGTSVRRNAGNTLFESFTPATGTIESTSNLLQGDGTGNAIGSFASAIGTNLILGASSSGQVGLQIENTNNAAGSKASAQFTNDLGKQGIMGISSSGFPLGAVFGPNGAFFGTDSAGSGLGIYTFNQPIKFSTDDAVTAAVTMNSDNTSFAGSIDLGGTTNATLSTPGAGLLAVEGSNVAFVSNPLSQFASTTSSQFKGVISDENAPDGASSKVIMALGSLSIASGKTFTSSNTLTLTATDGSTLAIGTGGTLGTAAYTAASAYEVPLTFSTGLTRSTNTVTVNTSQNIATLSNLTSNGFVKTGGGVGTLSVDTSTYLTGNQTITLTGDTTGSGATSIATTTSLLTGPVTETQSSSTTSSPVTTMTIGVNSTGTPVNGFGNKIKLLAEDNTSNGQDIGQFGFEWLDVTHATHRAKFTIAPNNGSGITSDILNVYGSGASGGGISVNQDVDPGAGIINAKTGFQVNNAAASGKALVADGTNFTAQTISGSGATISLGSTGVLTISAIANASLSNPPSDTAYASSWDAVTTISPTKNAVYDWGHTFDTDDDGKVNVLDTASGTGSGLIAVDSNGVLAARGRTTARGSSTSGTPGTAVASITAGASMQFVAINCAIGQANAANTTLTVTITYSDSTTTSDTTTAATAYGVIVNDEGISKSNNGSTQAGTAHSAKKITAIAVTTLGSGSGIRYASLAAIEIPQ